MTIPLAHIPLIDAPDGPVQLARLQAAKLKYLLRVTHEIVPAPLLRWADRHSEQWLRRCASPYVAEISEIAALLGEHGSCALNLNFEWGCTTACRAIRGEAPGIYRTLDWPFRLGADVVVARHRTNAGQYYNITWPGYVGVLTALAFELVIGTSERFHCGKQIASYVGLVPSEESSGDRRRLGHIRKQGNSLLRFLLVEAAQVTVRSQPQWRSKFFHLAMRRGRKIAKVAMARKLAVHLYWMWRKGLDYGEFVKLGSHAGAPGNRHGVQ